MRICYGVCGSFCTLQKSLVFLEELTKQGHEILPVGSPAFMNTDTRFGKAAEFRKKTEELCKRSILSKIEEAEPVGPKYKPDLMVIVPCTGNTLSKIANGISDTAVTLACKAHLRNEKPLLIALASNDALSSNFENLAKLYRRKNVYFVPLKQDDPEKKPTSAVFDEALLLDAFDAALKGKQLLPLFS